MKAFVTVCLSSLLALSITACGRGEILQVTPRPTRVAEAQPSVALPTADAETVVVEERQPTGDADAGRVVFNASYTTNAGVWMCNQCHSISPDEARLIGPGMWNIAVRAGSTVAGQDTYTYI